MDQQGTKPNRGTFEERDELQRRHRESLGQLRSAYAALHDLMWSLEELEQEIAALQEEQHDRSDLPRSARIARLQRQRTALEDQALRQMLRTDELAAQVAQRKQELDVDP